MVSYIQTYLDELKANWQAVKKDRFVEEADEVKKCSDFFELPFHVESLINDDLSLYSKVYERLQELFIKEKRAFPLLTQTPVTREVKKPQFNSAMRKIVLRTDFIDLTIPQTLSFINLANLIINGKTLDLFKKEIVDFDPVFAFKASEAGLDEFLCRRSLYPIEGEACYLVFNKELLDKHKFAPDFIFELSKLGYSSEAIDSLMPTLTYWFDEFSDRSRITPKNLISASIYLTCRGDNSESSVNAFQCPVNMRDHYAGFAKVAKYFPSIRFKVTRKPEELIKGVFTKAQRIFDLKDSFIDTCNTYFEAIKDNPDYLSCFPATATSIVFISLLMHDNYVSQPKLASKLKLSSGHKISEFYQLIGRDLIKAGYLKPQDFNCYGLQFSM